MVWHNSFLSNLVSYVKSLSKLVSAFTTKQKCVPRYDFTYSPAKSVPETRRPRLEKGEFNSTSSSRFKVIDALELQGRVQDFWKDG